MLYSTTNGHFTDETSYRQDTKEAKLRVADVMATLGEIGLESGKQRSVSKIDHIGE